MAGASIHGLAQLHTTCSQKRTTGGGAHCTSEPHIPTAFICMRTIDSAGLGDRGKSSKRRSLIPCSTAAALEKP